MQNGGTDPKKELDKAQFNRMQELLKRKRQAQKDAEVRIDIRFEYLPWII